MNKFLVSVCTAALLWSCAPPSNQDAKSVADPEVSANSPENVVLSEQEGLRRLTTYCNACHNPSSESHDNILAPPMAAVKYRWLQEYPDKEEFVEKMTAFVLIPSEEAALMRGPVKRFGLMPKLGALPPDKMQELVTYIYDNELRTPSWFPAHFEEEHGKPWEGQ